MEKEAFDISTNFEGDWDCIDNLRNTHANVRMDTSPQKRVELHCHTKMSFMDGVADARELIKQAYKWGHKAIAITDHGVAQAFPKVNHCFDYWGGIVPKDSEFKAIYGMEAYLVDDLKSIAVTSRDVLRNLPTYHATILVKNETGRINLYKLISQSHLKYYYGRPCVPKSIIEAHRDGLVIGSACGAGELYQALLRNAPQTELARIVDFYDYLEIQPLGNNRFMIADKRIEMVNSNEDLRELNRRIVKLGEKFKKPVAATGDVHFINPQDEICRRIILNDRGYSNVVQQVPLYLRTTQEMLDEFAYLGSRKAEEVVITNTNKIADMVEKISPIHPDKFYPELEGSDKELRKICFTKAYEIYGKPLPLIVQVRLESELHSIITNGYATMYILMNKLIQRAKEDGYPVLSRSPVGSSFVAAMSGITEINPLFPHYICDKCKYSDFDSEGVKKFAGMAGYDMPDKLCPKCGSKLKKDGFNIPFEAFSGINGEKEPYIDFCFPDKYLKVMDYYIKDIYGEGQTIKAGNVRTVTEKAARKKVRDYYEQRKQHKRFCEIDRVARGCTGVRSKTVRDMHKIMFLPQRDEIEQITPVQHLYNDQTNDTIITHFEDYSIDENLLKIGIGRHDCPTMLHMLEKLTGIDARTVPFDQKDVMSLFMGTKALGIMPEDIGGCKLGCLGVPEFGTDFLMEMLMETKAQNFSDLVRVVGLSQGVDTWIGNIQTLIHEGKATISTAPCTREDIMVYLNSIGVERSLAFKIMESVRKGKGLRSEWESIMRGHGVPDWYIQSCEKMVYVIPKAFVVDRVMMACRIAWYKIFYPCAFYAAFFAVYGTSFSHRLIGMGQEHVQGILNKGSAASKGERRSRNILRVAQEMYARGFEYETLDAIRKRLTDSFSFIGWNKEWVFD